MSGLPHTSGPNAEKITKCVDDFLLICNVYQSRILDIHNCCKFQRHALDNNAYGEE